MRERLITVLDFFGLACWLEITTNHPECIYYFGPFLSQREAQSYSQGYVEDLKGENAMGIITKFKRCKPKTLTIFDENMSYSKSVIVI